MLKVGVISTGGLVEPPKIILKNETLYYTLRGPLNARIPFLRTSILDVARLPCSGPPLTVYLNSLL